MLFYLVSRTEHRIKDGDGETGVNPEGVGAWWTWTELRRKKRKKNVSVSRSLSLSFAPPIVFLQTGPTSDFPPSFLTED